MKMFIMPNLIIRTALDSVIILLQSSLRASEADKRRMMDRIAKLEDELRVIRVTSG